MSALDTPIVHIVTYQNTANGAEHKEKYCPNTELRDGNDISNGLHWSVSANDLTLSTGEVYTTANGSIVKNAFYTTQSGTFKVINISETICL